MKITIQNSLFAFALFLSFSANAENVHIKKNISLYNEPKYAENFKHFEYANPSAPKAGKITMPNYGGFDNFNPFIFKGIAPSEVAELTLDTLGFVPSDDMSTVYPLVAESFELPQDKSFIGFFINKNAQFSNGEKISADDVVFSFNSLIEKGSPIYRVYYGDVEKVEKISNNHVRFIFKKDSKNKELPLIVAQIPIFSKKYWEGKDFAQPRLEPFLGSGPYTIEKFDAGRFIVLKRNSNYWAKNLPSRKGFYNFDEIRMDYYQDTTVTLQALFSNNIDIREEYIAKIWVSGYNNDLVKSGKIIKENIAHSNAATLQNFAFNIRRDKFKDRRVRQAIALAFNFDWANEKLFYKQYSRIYSYFTNTGMEAIGLPKGLELKTLSKYRKDLPRDVFEKAPVNPSHENHLGTRENLKKAVKLLQEAGYDFKDGKMTNLKTGEPLSFEVLSNSANGSVFTRVMLPFIKNLSKIGIELKFRNLEVNIFKNRLDNFDFDMAIVSFRVSQMPGNEQREMWGSKSADVKGSMNLIGIKNPVVDELITKMIQAQEKDEYIACVKALDRVLLNEQYMIPQWYSPHQRIAYWNKFSHPKTKVKTGFQPHTWWIKKDQ